MDALILVLLLLSHSFELSSLPVKLFLISVDLALLVLLFMLLALELISDKRTRSESKRTTDERSGSWVPDGAADETPCSGSPQSPDAGPFFSCG
jgi:hypothetical protein